VVEKTLPRSARWSRSPTTRIASGAGWRPDLKVEIDLVEEVGGSTGSRRFLRPAALPSGNQTDAPEIAAGRAAADW
jgi:hypothetical protein